MKIKWILIALIALICCTENAAAQWKYGAPIYHKGGVSVRYVGGSQWKRPYRAVRQRMHRQHFHKNPYRQQPMGNGYYRRSGCYH